MTNREKYIQKVNDLDMLVKIQACMAGCVIEALSGIDYPCPDDHVCMFSTCKGCIQKWLNEDVNNGKTN